MNIYSYLKKDHQKVATLFDKVIHANTKISRKTLFEELKEELLLHAESEHHTFYKALKSYPETKEIVQHGDKEHSEVKNYLARLDEREKDSKEW